MHPDGAPPEELERRLGLCRYEANGGKRLVFIAAYERNATPALADRLNRANRDESEAWIAPFAVDRGFLRYEGGWLTLEFVQGDMLVDYILMGSTLAEKGSAIVALPRPMPPPL